MRRSVMRSHRGENMDDVTAEVVGLIKELVEFETIKSKPEELRRCVDFVKDYFADTGLVMQEFERNDKPSLLIGFEKTLTPQLLLLGHLDVVESSSRLWSGKASSTAAVPLT